VLKLCKVYGLDDSEDPDPVWQELLEAMCPNWRSRRRLHRKYWEWGLGLYGLHRLGCIRPDALGLSVGAGIEWPLFYLADRVRRVDAIDFYSLGSHAKDRDPRNPEHAAQLAPFPYRREGLVFQTMDALDLQFEKDTFDFVFTFSSIEHFGGHAGAILAMQEIARVLKPGGVAVIATETVLNGAPHPEFFKPEDVEPVFVGGSGLELVEPLDLHVDAELISSPVPFDVPPGFQGDTGPHTSVSIGGVTFTSIEFFLRKPLHWEPASAVRLAALKAGAQSHGVQAQPTRGIRQRLRTAVKKLIRRPGTTS
jgi:SAM-dependent methyltransferase